MRPGLGVALGLAVLLSACQSYALKDLSREETETKSRPALDLNERQDLPASGIVAQTVAAPGDEAGNRLASAYRPIRPGNSAMIIRTGTASLQIDTLETAIARVRGLATRVGGYIANSEILAVEGGVRSATIEIKVPSDRFDELVNGLNPIGKLEQVNVSAQDVGEEFTDISARVVNGRRLEQRLIELIATRTGKLSDVLEIERELARVREEIERMEGRLRYLEAHAAVSSLSIRVHEAGPIVGQEGSLAVLAEAFRQAWRNSIGFAAAGIAAMGVFLPAAVLALLGVLTIRKLWRRRVA